jgi:hypothetical protein
VRQAANGSIRLVDTKKEGIHDRYMTLSYRWGDPSTMTLMLTRDNLNQMMAEIDISTLPTTFQHAVKITRHLDIQYLWIDSICITQDDKVDIHEEVQKMHQVYRKSYCNLTACFAENSTGGLFCDRAGPKKLFATVVAPKSQFLGDQTWTILPTDLWDRHLLGEGLFSRGWVYQERILAPRLIHFTSTQLVWECATMSACELLPSGLPHHMDTVAAIDRHWRERLQYTHNLRYLSPLSGTADISTAQFWISTVKGYTGCFLSHPAKDKLSAVWGIAKLVRDLACDRYAVGLFANGLDAQLAWRVSRPRTARRLDTVAGQAIPSWSWASIDASPVLLTIPAQSDYRRVLVRHHDGKSPVRFQLSGEDEDHFNSKPQVPSWEDFQRLQLQTQTRTSRSSLIGKTARHPYGDNHPTLGDIELPVKGRILHAPVIRSSAHRWTLDIDGVAQAKIEFFPDLERVPERHFMVLLVSTEPPLNHELPNHDAIGLGLEAVEEKDGRFRRTGCVHLHNLTPGEWSCVYSTSHDELGFVEPMNSSGDVDFWLM